MPAGSFPASTSRTARWSRGSVSRTSRASARPQRPLGGIAHDGADGAAGADELVFLDIAASHERRGPALAWIERVAESVFIPLTVGGGVRTLDDARDLLAAGADKVALNSAAVARPELLTELAERYGSQCVVLSVDVRRRTRAAPKEPRLGGRDAGRTAERPGSTPWSGLPQASSAARASSC